MEDAVSTPGLDKGNVPGENRERAPYLSSFSRLLFDALMAQFSFSAPALGLTGIPQNWAKQAG